jgi:hypothetical protein
MTDALFSYLETQRKTKETVNFQLEEGYPFWICTKKMVARTKNVT